MGLDVVDDGHAYGVVKHTRPPDYKDSGSHNQIERNIAVRRVEPMRKGSLGLKLDSISMVQLD